MYLRPRNRLTAFGATLLALASLALLLVLATSIASAEPASNWQPGPDAHGEYFCNGVIDTPVAGATVTAGAPVQVSGWIVDMNAEGWAGFDNLHVYDGLAGSGKFLTQGTVGVSRPDVAAAFGNQFYTSSGFAATIPGGALSAGQHTLSVYAHTPDKGWWYTQFTVNVVGQPAASTGKPTLGISQPEYGEKVYTADDTYTVIGYALDPAATIMQGSQGSGIDRVQVYVNDTYLGDAELGYSNSDASAFGTQFANAGFRFEFQPTQFHEGNAQLEVRAHSVVTGKETSFPTTFLVVEGKRPTD
jgi:hypothetical protein